MKSNTLKKEKEEQLQLLKNENGYISDENNLKKLRDLIKEYVQNRSNIPPELDWFFYRDRFIQLFEKSCYQHFKKKTLTEEQKEKKKKVNDNFDSLMHTWARVLHFLYVSVYREKTLRDVLNKTDPKVFSVAVGIEMDEFSKIQKFFKVENMNRLIEQFSFRESVKTENTEKSQYRNSFNWFGFGPDSLKS
ncbi:hypothetical protein [Mycoplasmoides pneumoniae]|uniref:hypothetical protein n=1 Tax=Mycoplasmoides pneumoniae TaxID=2104 RepID=UPI001F332D27|nr:hypothetical protein [Mycoplasmoides pneumoniae]